MFSYLDYAVELARVAGPLDGEFPHGRKTGADASGAGPADMSVKLKSFFIVFLVLHFYLPCYL
jgi:hypothetical protein